MAVGTTRECGQLSNQINVITSCNKVSSQKIFISPNPVQNIIHITSLSSVESYELRVMNETGNVLQQILINNSSSFNINVSALKAGVYYLNVQTKEKKETMRFVKE